MVETISPGAGVAVAMPPNAPEARREYLYPDGSAVPDVIAYHHRPEDLDDTSDQTVPDATDSAFFGADGMTFGDLLDIINPLQHIPIVSTLYRALTGDEISPGARIAGGALFGGPIGLGIAIVNAAIEASTGADLGDTIMTALTGDAPATAATTQLADTAVTATDSNPALLAARTMPISLLPPAASPPIAAGVLFAGSGLPFGGRGGLPFAAASETANDPVAAVLRARTAVPMAGPVPGLGGAPLGRVDRQSPLPLIDTRLSDKLAALAARTATQFEPPNRDDDDSAARNAGPAARSQPATTTVISQTMLNALDRYRDMKRAELDGLPRG